MAEGGNAITVDGTDAMANPETRGMSQYGGQSQTSIMSIDAVAEVQVIKGILPAEYGGVVGGQVNFITRSGTNQFHGSAFENYQSQIFFARDTFLPATSQKPEDTFNQFGGSLGGPILRQSIVLLRHIRGISGKLGRRRDSHRADRSVEESDPHGAPVSGNTDRPCDTARAQSGH